MIIRSALFDLLNHQKRGYLKTESFYPLETSHLLIWRVLFLKKSYDSSASLFSHWIKSSEWSLPICRWHYIYIYWITQQKWFKTLTASISTSHPPAGPNPLARPALHRCLPHINSLMATITFLLLSQWLTAWFTNVKEKELEKSAANLP